MQIAAIKSLPVIRPSQSQRARINSPPGAFCKTPRKPRFSLFGTFGIPLNHPQKPRNCQIAWFRSPKFRHGVPAFRKSGKRRSRVQGIFTIIRRQPSERLNGRGPALSKKARVGLGYKDKYQQWSLDPNPASRIPSNFWIELYPVLELCRNEMTNFIKHETEDGIIDALIGKYRIGSIKSVLHFRRIIEAR
ncbi:MAG TPA: hypothetical protein VJT54_03825 [Verrucomicrobiae bacterium]|nr:hypothetical protein [Verrucomicrobiae bacterium]